MASGDLHVSGLSFRFPGQASDLLRVEQLSIAHGQTLGIRGASGAGKLTLLHCLAGIEAIAGGCVRWGDEDIATLSPGALTRWRAQRLGLVFQDFHLVEGLSALGNILLPASFNAWRVAPVLKRRAAQLLERVGAPNRRAELLSRGERQRVAVARALIFKPEVILADEPTASLDPESREVVSTLLLDLVREQGATLIVVSHEDALLAKLDRQLELRGGELHLADTPQTTRSARAVGDEKARSFRAQREILVATNVTAAQKIPHYVRNDLEGSVRNGMESRVRIGEGDSALNDTGDGDV